MEAVFPVRTDGKRPHGGPISKGSMEEAASGAALPGDEPPIPNIRADFPPFGSKSVHLSGLPRF